MFVDRCFYPLRSRSLIPYLPSLFLTIAIAKFDRFSWGNFMMKYGLDILGYIGEGIFGYIGEGIFGYIGEEGRSIRI